ncbi:MAG: M23 family metallopeptidase [Rubrivivax sp.]
MSALSALAVAPLAAISSLAPDAAFLPQRRLVQPLPLRGTVAPPTALLAAQERLAHARHGLARHREHRGAARAPGRGRPRSGPFLKRNTAAARVLQGRAVSLVRVRAQANGRLLELTARFPSESPAHRATQFARLVVNRGGSGQWQSLVEEAAFETQVRLAAGTIRTTLFAATEAADVPDAVAVQLAEIFAVDLDFHRQLKRGDRFVVAYEVLSADGEPVPWDDGVGRVLAAEFANGCARAPRAVRRPGRRHRHARQLRRARRQEPPPRLSLPARWRSRACRRASRCGATRSTSAGSRTSAWTTPRPKSTPVRAIGDGVVETASESSGYGRMVTLAHGKDRASRCTRT